MDDAPTPTPRELEILGILWNQGDATVREVADVMRAEEDIAQNTVQTFLRVMEDKGLVEHTTRGRAFVYRPTYGRERWVRRIFRSRIRRRCRSAGIESAASEEAFAPGICIDRPNATRGKETEKVGRMATVQIRTVKNLRNSETGSAMNGILADAMEHRQLDIAVAVCLLLSVALLLLRFVWQPAKRLWIIEWAVLGGLLLAMGWISPWHQFSLGVLRPNQKSSYASASSLQSDRRDLLSLSRRDDVAPFDHNDAEQSSSASRNAIDEATKLNDIDAKIFPSATPSFAAIAAEPSRWSRWILGVYALGAVGMMLWLAVGQWTVHWLVRHALSTNFGLDAHLATVACGNATCFRFPRCRHARLLISVDLSHPVAVGIFRPAVLLPQWLVHACTLEQLRPILAHEVARVMRRDAASDGWRQSFKSYSSISLCIGGCDTSCGYVRNTWPTRKRRFLRRPRQNMPSNWWHC